MRPRSLVSLALIAVAAGCTTDIVTPGSLARPTELSYQLVPSGDPNAPSGVVLRWTEPSDSRVTNYVVYSRASGGAWSRRAETTSNTFHDAGIPHDQYYVTSQDAAGAESEPSAAVTVDLANRLPTPTGLVSISLDGAIQLGWSNNAHLGRFDYYRVYSTTYDLDAGVCAVDDWFLEGTTFSEDFLVTGLTNGRPLCFAVTAVTLEGAESFFSSWHADTPRPDGRNIILDAVQANLATSGFRFFLPSANTFANVQAGDRTDIDFKIDRLADGSIWIVPVRADVGITLYSTSPTVDLTSIDIAPETGFSRDDAWEAVPGYAYVIETSIGGVLHYGAIRITHVGSDYVIFDWSYQTDPGNPELTQTVRPFGR